MSVYCAEGGPDREIGLRELERLLTAALEKLGPRKRVLVVPPDHTRASSRAGELTHCAWRYYGDSLSTVLPALGTHKAMSPQQIHGMFGIFRPASFVRTTGAQTWKRLVWFRGNLFANSLKEN